MVLLCLYAVASARPVRSSVEKHRFFVRSFIGSFASGRRSNSINTEPDPCRFLYSHPLPPPPPYLHITPAPKGRREKKESRICNLTHLCVYEETCPPPPPPVRSFILFIHSFREKKQIFCFVVCHSVCPFRKKREKEI